jgi:ribosomal protein L7/L12
MVIELTAEQVNQVRAKPNYFDTHTKFIDSIKEIRAMFGLGLLEAKVIAECIREVQGHSVKIDNMRMAGQVFAQIVQQARDTNIPF